MSLLHDPPSVRYFSTLAEVLGLTCCLSTLSLAGFVGLSAWGVGEEAEAESKGVSLKRSPAPPAAAWVDPLVQYAREMDHSEKVCKAQATVMT